MRALNKLSCPPPLSLRLVLVRAGQDQAAAVTGVCVNISAKELPQQPLEPLRCAWEGCSKPLDQKGSLFYNITDTTNAGSRDWSALVGSTLCRACYVRFGRSGSLDQQRKPRQRGVQGAPRKIRRGEEGVRSAALNGSENGDGHDATDCAEGEGGIKDSDEEDRFPADDMDIRMLAPDEELPTLVDVQRLHKSFQKLRPSLMVKDQEYISTDSDPETGEADEQEGEGNLYLSQSQMPDIRNACESLMKRTLLMHPGHVRLVDRWCLALTDS